MPNKKRKKENCEIITKVEKGKEKTVRICDTTEEKEEVLPKNVKEKEERQLKTIMLIGGVILVAFIVFMFLRVRSTNFEYAGLDFKTEEYGEVTLFHAQIPIKDTSGDIKNYFNVYLRNDPRTVTEINVPETIVLKKNIFLSVNPNVADCSQIGLAGMSLGQFLGVTRNSTTASTDKAYAEENNLAFADCSFTTSDRTVIIVEKGNENIIKDENGCYIIQYKDCDILKSVERFIVGTYASYNGVKI